ncbi:Monocarboxylate transporter 12, partial [Stegodyphus mimosarum]
MICHPMFHIISLSLAVYNMLFDPSLAVIVDYVKDKGFENSVAKYFLSLLSLGDLIGKLCFCWITDRNYLSLPKYMMLLLVVQGVCFFLIPLSDASHVLTILVVIYGTASGATLVMFPILVENYLISVQTLAIGCITFLSGVLSFAVPPLIGYFRDNMGSYDGMFYLLGTSSLLVGLLWLLEPMIYR